MNLSVQDFLKEKQNKGAFSMVSPIPVLTREGGAWQLTSMGDKD